MVVVVVVVLPLLALSVATALSSGTEPQQTKTPNDEKTENTPLEEGGGEGGILHPSLRTLHLPSPMLHLPEAFDDMCPSSCVVVYMC